MAEPLINILVEFWGVLGQMAPYLLFGFLAAGILSIYISPEAIERHLGGGGLKEVFKSALLGVPLPLCSCGVIPVGASLKRHGASSAATIAFLISTPQTGVDSILATFSLLGLVFAIFRPLFALISGMLGGVAVALLGDGKATGKGKRFSSGQVEPVCREACCAISPHGKFYRAIEYGFVSLPRDIGRAVLIGLLVAGIISAMMPKDMFVGTVFGEGSQAAGTLVGQLLGIVMAMLVGIPIYVCATASIPVAAALVLQGGLSPGAAFAFLVTGPATNAATVAMIWKVMGRRTALLYLGTMAISAIVGGLLINMIVSPDSIRMAHEHGWMLPEWGNSASAIVLFGLLAASMWPRHKPEHLAAAPLPEGQALETVCLAVEGMSCQHCVESVTHALKKCDGVRSVAVDLRLGTATVTGTSMDSECLRQTVEAAGYHVARVDTQFENLRHVLADELIARMTDFFGQHKKQVQHALEVLDYATVIAASEGGDSLVVQAAAILHHVGPADEITRLASEPGKSAEKLARFEREYTQIAREIFATLAVDQARIDHILRIITHLAAGQEMDTVEFRIVADADRLVENPGEAAGLAGEELDNLLRKNYHTAAGRQIATRPVPRQDE